ncbi:cytochrome P450, partial [Trifolium medium]|nr:cytochrome P450 [Trifolium medium]
WRIDNESSIKVMNEQWLRVEDGRWTETPQNQGSKEAWNVVGLGNVLQQRLNENQSIHELYAVPRLHRLQVRLLSSYGIFGMKVIQMWEEWATVQGLIEEQNHMNMQQQTALLTTLQWLPPRPGYLKCNVDASFYNAVGTAGVGWCLRDHCGHFVLAGTNLIQGRLSTVEGAAITLEEAIEQGLNRGLSHVIFESNSKVVVDAISSRQAITNWQMTVEECNSTLIN